MTFTSTLPADEIARRLAAVIYPESYGPVSDGVPFLTESGWWELSLANDHKLDVLGSGRFRFRDRYDVAERRARVIAAIEDGIGTLTPTTKE